MTQPFILKDTVISMLQERRSPVTKQVSTRQSKHVEKYSLQERRPRRVIDVRNPPAMLAPPPFFHGRDRNRLQQVHWDQDTDPWAVRLQETKTANRKRNINDHIRL